MKIAILSDIHGNKYALEEAIRFCEQEAVHKYVFLGDYIGYYPFGDEVVEQIKKKSGYFIKGNHEESMFKSKEYVKLSQESSNWISRLPLEKDLNLSNKSIKIIHSTELNGFFYIYPDAPEEYFVKHFFSLYSGDYDYIFTGHTHYPYQKKVGNGFIINPGSVGQSRDVGGLVSFGILDLGKEVYRNIRLKYDVQQLIEDLLEMGIEEDDYRITSLSRR